MFTQMFIKIFHSVQEIGLFSLFQKLALGKTSTNDKCHFAISRCRQYQCVCKILSKYSKRFRVIDIFCNLFFRNWRSAKPRPMINAISQSLDVVNINAYAKFYQNIPNGLELSTFFTNRSVTKSSGLSFRSWVVSA